MVEVLMAVAVFLIVAGVAMDTGTRQLVQVAAAYEESRARWCAAGELERLRAAAADLREGRVAVPLEDGLSGERNIRLLEPELFEVKVTVRWRPRGAVRDRQVSLTTWIFREEPR